MAYSASFALDLGVIGLTLKARLTTAGTISGSDLTGTFYSDLAGGYEFRTSALANGTRGMLVFYTGTFSVNFSSVTVYSRASINPEELEYIDTAISGISGSSGSGAYTVTVTVTDGSNPLENANVRLVEGGTNILAQTNASGVSTFALDAATYAITITKAGYSFTPTTIVVTAAANFPESMTATSVPAAPSDPTLCRIFGYIINGSTGRPAVGAQMTATRVPESAAYSGGILIGNRKSATADVDGLVLLDVPQTDEITMLDGSSPQWKIVIPAAGFDKTVALTTTTYDLGALFA